MGSWTVRLLRVALVLSLVGSVAVQALLLVLGPREMGGLPVAMRLALIGFLVLGIVCMQVVGVCVWRLVTMVREDTVFSAAAFRYVDIVIGAIVAGGACVLGLGYALAQADDAPGLVLIGGGAAVVVGGVALVVVVMRALLAQAVATRAEAQHLRDELAEVV